MPSYESLPLFAAARAAARESGGRYDASPRATPGGVSGRPQLDAPSLQAWKARVRDFQQQVRETPLPVQGNLLSASGDRPQENRPEAAWDSDRVDPLQLPFVYGLEFYDCAREPVPESPSLYFVFDRAADLVLYIGEAQNPIQRWNGEHDCKRYARNYTTCHRELGLPVAVNIAIWPHAWPDARRRRQQERRAILRWRSPFNKENWSRWGTPFADGRSAQERSS